MTPFALLGEMSKEAARGDQFLRAATKALTPGATKMDPHVRFGALQKLVGGGYSGGGANAIARMLKGQPDKLDETSSILKLLTGHGTANTNQVLLSRTVQDAARGASDGRYMELRPVSDLRNQLPELVRLFAGKRQTTKLPGLKPEGVMSALKV